MLDITSNKGPSVEIPICPAERARRLAYCGSLDLRVFVEESKRRTRKARGWKEYAEKTSV
jgi:hypothetical protein